MNWIWICLLCFLSRALVAAENSAWVLVTWNLGNYLKVDRQVGGSFRPSHPKPLEERESIHALLAVLRPDLMLVQEIGGAAEVRELALDAEHRGLSWPYWAVSDGPDEERRMALLSRWPVVEHRTLRPELKGESGRSSRRGVLLCRVATPAGSLWVAGLHLKSRHSEDTSDPDSFRWRLAEARAVRDALAGSYSLATGVPCIVGGDFNAAIGSPELDAFSRRGERVLWHRLPAADPRGDVWTYRHARSGTYSTFDHLWIRPDEPRLEVLTATVAAFEPAGTPPSDHRPVVLRFRLMPRKDEDAEQVHPRRTKPRNSGAESRSDSSATSRTPDR